MAEIISIHVQKTAGTAFGKVLQQVYGPEQIYLDYEYAAEDADFVLQQGLITPQIQAIHGHFEVKKYRDRFPNAKFIVWLRNPIYRIISIYFFLNSYTENFFSDAHEYIVKHRLSLLEMAEMPEMQNFMSRFFFRDITLSDLDFVGLQEFYTEDLMELKDKMGWTKGQPRFENVNQYPDYGQNVLNILSDSDLVKKIARLNAKDIELYQQAVSLRAMRRQESLSLQYTLAGFNQSQFLLSYLQNEVRQLQDRQHQMEAWQNHPNPVIQVEVVLLTSPQDSERLLGAAIDLPPRFTLTGEWIDIRGWAIGKGIKAISTRVLYCHQTVTEVPIKLYRPDVVKAYSAAGVEESGFELKVVLSGMTMGTELLVQVVFEDQSNVDIGLIRFTQASEVLKDLPNSN